MATLTTDWQNLGSANWTNISNANMTLQGRYTSQDTNENKTYTEFRVVTGGSTSWRTYNGSASYNGSFSDSFNIATAPSYVDPGSVLMSISKPVTHNDDGTKSLSLGASGYIVLNDGTRYFNINDGNGNPISITLPKINRRSIFSLNKTTFDIGEIIQATITQYVSSYHQDLYMVIGNSEVLIQSSASGTVDIETNLLANMIYQQIPNAKYYENEFRLKTFNSSNQLIGTTTVSYRANVVDSEPTFNVAYQDTNSTTTAITSDNQKIIQNKSTLRIKITNASVTHYAGGLSKVEVIINNISTEYSISGTTSVSKDIDVGTLNLSSNTTAKVRLYDSRGFYTEKSLTLTILEWHIPNSQNTIQRKQNFYTETDFTIDANYSSLDGNNTITIECRYKKTSDSTWGSWNTLQDNTTSTFNLDNLYAWNIQVRLTDRLATYTYENLSIGVGTPIFFVDKKKFSCAVFSMPQYNNSLELNGVDLSNTYSTTERPIGRWIDGSIIYRKVIDTGTHSQGDGNIYVNHNISNLGLVIRAYGMCVNTYNNNDSQYTIPAISNADSDAGTTQIGITVTSTQVQLLIGRYKNFNKSSFVVLEYTKVV